MTHDARLVHQLLLTATVLDILFLFRYGNPDWKPLAIGYLGLLLQAGGLTDFASPGRARLYRTADGRTKIYPVDLDAILQKGDLHTNYTLYPSDVVTVPERNF